MRSALKFPLVVLTCLLVLGAGLLLTLAGTGDGTRLLAEQVRRWSGDAFDWESVEGTLLGSLKVQGLRLRQPDLDFHFKALTLDWQPSALLGGRLQIDRLEAVGVRIAIADAEEAPPTAARPFRPAELQLPVDIWIQDVQVRDLQLQIGEQPARSVERVALALRLVDRQLSLQKLVLRTTKGGLTANGSLELSEALPLSLELDWDWVLPDQRRSGGRLLASGDAGVLSIEHLGSGDLPIRLQGQLTDVLDSPGWELELSWPELLLSADEAPLLLGPGRIESGGNLDGYRIASEGRFLGMGLEPGRWSLQAKGNAAGLQLAPLVLASGPGELELAGSLDWSGPFTVDLGYRMSGEQLIRLHPELPSHLDAQGYLQARYQGEELTLERLTLTMDQAPLRLDLRASVQLPESGEPAVDGRLEWSGLNWPLTAAIPALASPEGRLELAGTAAKYTFNLVAVLAGSKVPRGEWQGQGSGSRSELSLQRLQGKLLGGELSVSGALGWAPDPGWNVQVQARELDPGRWIPELAGRLDLALRSSGGVDPAGMLRAEVELERLAGQLAGRDIGLIARAELAGDELELQSLQLDSGGNQLGAQGQLSPILAMDWQLQAPAPGALLPGAEGRLTASGRLEGRPEAPQLQARLQGRDLRLDTLSLSRLEAELQAGPGADDPLRLDFELGPVLQSDQTLLQAVHVQARGKTSQHWLELNLQGPTDLLQVRLEGGLEDGREDGQEGLVPGAWRGLLAVLSAESNDYGAWRLVQAAPVAMAATGLSLGEACLMAVADPARICARGEWEPILGARLTASLQALQLQRLRSELSGELNGELDAGLAADGALRVRAALAMSPGQLRVDLAQGVQQLTHDGGRLDLAIDPGGLDAQLLFESRQQRLVEIELQLPGFDRLPLSESQPLAGRIQARLNDLSGLPVLVPAIAESAGRLDADLRLDGTLQQPRILGELTLADGAADIPEAGLQLRQIELRASSDPEHAGKLDLDGGLVSGPGRVDLEGWVDLPGNAMALRLKGEQVQVYSTPDARALASPELRIDWSDQLLTLRGHVLIPEAAITPKLGLGPSMLTGDPSVDEAPGQIIASSADVVVLGVGDELMERPLSAAPFRLNSQVELILGERVKVNALGFVGRISGAVTFINRPEQQDLIPDADGRLSILDGTFRALGQDLEIETGQVIFAGVPVTEPELAIRAVRWIDNDPQITAAGVMISGTATEPSLELFSRPQLDPTEVQSYLLTGRSASGRESVLSIGTYLHRKIYVGYGHNLLEQTNEFNALYTITPRYGVGASVGEADNTLNLTFTYER